MKRSSSPAANTILVTGATGFIGSALCLRLLSAGWKVRGTLLASEEPSALAGGVESVVVEPLGAHTPWAHALAGIDTVVHVAARVHVMQDSCADPLAEYCRVNTEGTARLAREAVKAGVKRLVFISTIKVNGEESPTPYTEDSPPNPTDPYGISKWEAERALRQIEEETGLEVVVVRSTLVYGPGVKANFLRMMKTLRGGTPLPLASIKNRRSLVYLGNLVDALALCSRDPRAAGHTFLMSDGEDVSTPELMRLMASALGTPARLFPFPTSLMHLAGRLTGRSDQVRRLTGSLAVDSSKIRTVLDWQPPYTLAAGLKDTAGWYLATHGGAP